MRILYCYTFTHTYICIQWYFLFNEYIYNPCIIPGLNTAPVSRTPSSENLQPYTSPMNLPQQNTVCIYYNIYIYINDNLVA